MNKVFKGILILAAMFVAVSCAKDELDPLRFNTIGKGTILALRGTQLTNIYSQGKPGAEFYPRIISGNEKYEFEAELLSTDPDILESMEVFAIKRTPGTSGVTLERRSLGVIPASDFVKDDRFVGPWVSVSFDLTEILEAIDLDYTIPADVDKMLTTYKTGVSIETDLTLKDGTKILASEIVAAGLFASNQFYPAQRLNYAVIDYCTYEESFWAGAYDATENSENFGGYGPYAVAVTADGTVPNRFRVDNWYDSGIPIYFDLAVSTDVASQVATIPSQPNPNNPARTIAGTGTYNQCLGEIVFNMTYKEGATDLDVLVWKIVKN
jgi:hypothetical protein